MQGAFSAVHNMTRNRRALREAAAQEEQVSKMAPPHHASRPQGEQTGGGDRAAEAASKLQRFAHASQAAQGSPQSCLITPKPTQEPLLYVMPSTQLSQGPLQCLQSAPSPIQGSLLDSQLAPQSMPGSPGTMQTSDTINPILAMDEGLQFGPPLLSPVLINPDLTRGEPQSTAISVSPPAEPTMRDVYAAISTCNSTLASLHVHIGDLKHDMSYVRKDLQAINERVKATEERISAVEDQLPPMSKDLKRASQQIAFLLNKVDDLENRSRRNNIRVVGVPEKSKGYGPCVFL